MGGGTSKPLADGRIVELSGSGEGECHGLYVETARPLVSNKSGKPSFVYAGRTRNKAKLVIWWVDSGEQWNIGKFPRAKDIASRSKLWYIASARTGADVSSLLPPSTGWAVSAKSTYRAMGEAAYTIDPAPTCRMLGADELPPAETLQDMFKRGVKYAADGE